MQEVAERIRRVEERLERLLASGWRNAGAEAADLVPEAEALAELGLAELAERLRKVAAADSAAEALAAIAMAMAACRLVRARIPADAAPPASLAPLAPLQAGKRPSPDRLLPVARMALAGGEAWACAMLRGTTAIELVMLEPFPPAAYRTPEGPRPRAPGPMAPADPRDLAGSPEGGTPWPSGEPPWLRRQLQGHLLWRARYPLGAGGEVQCCALADHRWLEPPDPEHDPLAPFRHALASDKLQDGLPVLIGWGPLRVKELEASEVSSYVWPDPAVSAAFQGATTGRAWAVAWVQEALIAPLALLVPGGKGHQPQLLHLVPGTPADPLPD